MRGLAAIIMLVLVAACTGTPGGPIEAGPATPAPATTGPEAMASEYRLASGDEIRVDVFGEEALSGEFVIGARGNVSMPLIGEVPAAGKTIGEFRADLESRYADGYLNDPRVSAEVLNFRPFYILGEVESSGEYPYSDGMTVLNAVARAGGFTYRANTRIVFIKRAGTNVEVEVPLTPDLQVMPGDTIRIGERFF